MSRPEYISYLFRDEAACVDELGAALSFETDTQMAIEAQARELVTRVRNRQSRAGELEAFFRQYSLSSEEGIALMCLAEALLRIPDSRTADELIKDKLTGPEGTGLNWRALPGQRGDWLVELAGYGLDMSSRTLDSLFARLGAPVIRRAIYQAMRIMGHQFVLGRTMDEAMRRARQDSARGYSFSYDMLGEGARTSRDAQSYFEKYDRAIDAIGRAMDASRQTGKPKPGISVKLSALHPRFETALEDRCVPALVDRLGHLAAKAADYDIALTMDAEESERLDLSLTVFEKVAARKDIKGWDGLGLAVQAYQKRCWPLIDYLEDLARKTGRNLPVRLVKGAYWDNEIKRAQVLGLPEYPVFTRKANTDLAFLACAGKLMAKRDVFYPMLATHNAYSIAAILEMARDDTNGFEFQRLHGMGEGVYEAVLEDGLAPVTIYAPVGGHADLLPYLVRRLLENGANSSFINQISNPEIDIDEMVQNPVRTALDHPQKRHDRIPLPPDIYGPRRRNSAGLDLDDRSTLDELQAAMARKPDDLDYQASPLIGGESYTSGNHQNVINPAIYTDRVGDVWYAPDEAIEKAFESAKEGFKDWRRRSSEYRASCLERLAELLEENRPELMGLCIREGGKTIRDSLDEVREAVDFCRYYAMRGRVDFADGGHELPGPTGEDNRLSLHGRGVFVCISPWNFPVAIFTGQIAAALMAGNAVIAKPAEQTSLIAARVIELMLEAGIPENVIALLPGDGEVGARLVEHRQVAGVAFTGSTGAAHAINKALAAKSGPITPLIAETGGQNAMIVDSSALAEQVIDDVLASAFGSAGQRCSALRVLYIQDDVADTMIDMLAGAMAELAVGNPADIATDIGPVIDEEAYARLTRHKARLEGIGHKIAAVPVPGGLDGKGHYFGPLAYEIHELAELEEEVFGPVLHIIRYKSGDLDKVIDDINATGYGLTLGVHTRIDSRARYIARSVDVGNTYINRSMTGAVVGVQPFGGQNLSGTGPKAGGPHYLPRFATEKAVSVDTTAKGGNAGLVNLAEND